MHYLGGKYRIAKQLGQFLNSRIKDNQRYYEPFVGAAWVLKEINNNAIRYALDIHEDLILMYQKLQEGWIPPDIVTEDEYQYYKTQAPSALRGFIGFACSWGGKWFGGYARDNTGRNYALNGKRSLIELTPYIKDVTFSCNDYRHLNLSLLPGSIIYCDPPYEKTTKYKSTQCINYNEFWNTIRNLSQYNEVYVSSYSAPDDFYTILEIPTKTDIRNKKGEKETRVERLFSYKQIGEY